MQLEHIFSSAEAEAMLLVDASNAFNSMNRNMALQNVRIICPSLATILINTYRKASLHGYPCYSVKYDTNVHSSTAVQFGARYLDASDDELLDSWTAFLDRIFK